MDYSVLGIDEGQFVSLILNVIIKFLQCTSQERITGIPLPLHSACLTLEERAKQTAL